MHGNMHVRFGGGPTEKYPGMPGQLAGGLPNNQAVAAVAASYVEKLLTGTCRWMASYFDLDYGTLRCVPADPKLVAETAQLHRNAVAAPTRRG